MKIEIDIPKTENKGEDAPPINISSADGKHCLVGVFDGLGGAGSTMYEEDGEIHSGAYIASRIARDTTESFFIEKIKEIDFQISKINLESLKNNIKDALTSKLKKQKFQQSKLKSALIKTFPTTLAVGYATFDADKIKIETFWAGDSRVYALLPEKGLVQLTKDDLKLDNDPYQNIEFDSPLSNLVNLDEDFKFNNHSYQIPCPAILIAASDGCYGYYSTPMHFEEMILESLRSSNNIEDWKKEISIKLASVSGDDCTMAVNFIDTEDKEFFHIKELYRERQEVLYGQFMKEINKIESTVKELTSSKDDILSELKAKEFEKQTKCLEMWNKYKIDNYCEFNK